jgi:hypothetical protein
MPGKKIVWAAVAALVLTSAGCHSWDRRPECETPCTPQVCYPCQPACCTPCQPVATTPVPAACPPPANWARPGGP